MPAVNTIAIAFESADQTAWIALTGAPPIVELAKVLLPLTTPDAISDLLMTIPNRPELGRYVTGEVQNATPGILRGDTYLPGSTPELDWRTWLPLMAGLGVETAYRWTPSRWQVTTRVFQAWLPWGDLTPLAERLEANTWKEVGAQ